MRVGGAGEGEGAPAGPVSTAGRNGCGPKPDTNEAKLKKRRRSSPLAESAEEEEVASRRCHGSACTNVSRRDLKDMRKDCAGP